MMYKNLLCTLTLTLLALFSTTTIAKIYVYKDSAGIYHYSDKPPLSVNFKIYQTRQIDTIRWEKTDTKLIIKRKNKQKSYAQEPDVQQKCQQLKIEISKVTEMLRTKLKVKEFDQLKYKQNKIRWEYQKYC
ncbi:DUF4124 domain-containing protein [Aliikangiella sp. IMCC44359]|uniref:DUF4124 domain-containing protein n=1 Tax=Aliikangiella sp. IMCC44359 TaxID=3459125 RepID=UPI00403AB3B5